MKKEFFTIIAFSCVLSAFSENAMDSIQHIHLNEIIVSSTRIASGSPIAHSNIKASQIEAQDLTKNIPYLLESLPSVVTFSEDGSGVGNTSMRIRGTDATRINVTLNGMPMNNPETQEVYWVNLPNLSGSIQNIQVQRGIGSSTNGSGAFGASISLKTNGSKINAYGEASTAVGSYSTISTTIAAGTGLLKNGLSLDGRYSFTTGNGYIRNGKVNHKSIYTALSYYKENQLLRLSYINGIQHTGITWEGISPEQMAVNRKYNPAGEYRDDAGNVHYYDNETDNYYSDIVQLTYSNELNRYWSFNSGISYNHGYGYYENYKPDSKFENYGVTDQLFRDSIYTESDMVTRKAMKNNLYSINATFNFSKDKLNLVGGISTSIFDGDHFGRIQWVKYNENIPTNYEWYLNKSNKTDYNLFARTIYSLNNKISLFADFQYRYIYYSMRGKDDDSEDITNKNKYHFFNPKLGITYNLDGHELYGTLAISNREPLRSDIKESVKGGNTQKIRPERMFDYEIGYKYANKTWSGNANFYYMFYKNQMIQTGKINDVGYKLMENVPASYRSGIELSGSYQPAKWLRFDANLTLSSNKIKNYTAYYDLYDNNWNFTGQVTEHLGKTDISFSPNIIGSSTISIAPFKDFTFSASGKYVGKQYLDNSSNANTRLNDYFVMNLSSKYTLKVRQIAYMDFQLFINNLLNHKYVANGWAATDKFTDNTQITYIGLYPQATCNITAKCTIRF